MTDGRRRRDVIAEVLSSVARERGSSTTTPWVPLGEKAQVRGAIQWESPVLLPLGANAFLEMANYREALTWCQPALVEEEGTVGTVARPEDEVDIREELTANDIRLIESRQQGERRIAHVPMIGRSEGESARTHTLFKDFAELQLSRTQDQTKPDAHEHGITRPVALEGVVRERSTPSSETITQNSSLASPSTSVSLFKQSQSQTKK